MHNYDNGGDTFESQQKMNEYMNFQTPSDQVEQHYIDSGQAQKDYEEEKKMAEEGEEYAKMYMSVFGLMQEREQRKKGNKKMRSLTPEEQEYLFQKIEELEQELFSQNMQDIDIDKGDIPAVEYESSIKPEDLPF